MLENIHLSYIAQDLSRMTILKYFTYREQMNITEFKLQNMIHS